jgi:hypothetical protein
MQRASDSLADDQAVGERATIVRAVRPDSEESAARADQHDLVVANLAGESRSVYETSYRNARRQVCSHFACS